MANKMTIEDMAVFCKSKGFVYPSAELYGGLAGFFDLGPLGVEVANNIKQHWWKTFVQSRDDMVGLDGSIVTNPKVWVASGHVECFEDVMVECKKCHARIRGDHLLEDQLKIQADGLSLDDITKLIKENKIKCPQCKGELGEGRQFNLMFQTQVGPAADESAKSYLRPETAQLIFADFKMITDTTRLKLPFGVAQIGKAFRNEIAPRDFLFRCREFEQMEIEYFIHPKQVNECPYVKEVLNHRMLVFSSEMQEKNQQPKEMSMKEALDKKIIKTPWHAYWLSKMHQWFTGIGATPSKFRIRQHLPTEKSHYALDTWDLEYEFPFGWKELQGMANRTDFDLQQHMKHSKKDLSLFDEESKQKVVPHVVA
ncbi:glycine--tRNA ligase, partial [Candidatus Woesearchaeota archaeon]|nr:glycine--tRNA ligase [Candidatus Woesearchaeota archaeon]